MSDMLGVIACKPHCSAQKQNLWMREEHDMTYPRHKQ